MKRTEVFARDGYRCVYCGVVHDVAALSVDHVQPRVRGGDGSGGNVVTACTACNTAKAHTTLPRFLLERPDARRNFFALARYVWPRHLIAVAEELARRGGVSAPADFVEGVRRLRGAEAIASFVSRALDGPPEGGPESAQQETQERGRTTEGE